MNLYEKIKIKNLKINKYISIFDKAIKKCGEIYQYERIPDCDKDNPYCNKGHEDILLRYENQELRDCISTIIEIKRDFLLTDDFIFYLVFISSHIELPINSRISLVNKLNELVTSSDFEIIKMLSDYVSFVIMNGYYFRIREETFTDMGANTCYDNMDYCRKALFLLFKSYMLSVTTPDNLEKINYSKMILSFIIGDFIFNSETNIHKIKELLEVYKSRLSSDDSFYSFMIINGLISKLQLTESYRFYLEKEIEDIKENKVVVSN